MKQSVPSYRDIFQSFRIASDFRKAFLAFLWIIITIFGFELYIFFVSEIYIHLSSFYLGKLISQANLPILFSQSHSIHVWELEKARDFFISLWQQGLYFPVLGFFLMAIGWPYAWWSLLGGSIHRISAVEIATGNRISLKEAIQFSRKHYFSFFHSPFLLFCSILFFLFFNILLGWIGSFLQTSVLTTATGIPFGTLWIAFLWIVLLINSVLLFFCALGLVFTPGIMFCSVAMDGLDQYDAVSRGFMFFLHRFWQFCAYHLIAFVYAIPTTLFFIGVSWIVWSISLFTLKLGMKEPLPFWIPWRETICDFNSVLFSIIVLVYFGFVAGFVVSHYVCLKTTIYVLLRHNLDGSNLEDYYQEREQT